jgi:hypothetical protein
LLKRKLAVDYRLELPLAGEGDQPFHRLATRLRIAGSLDAATFFLQLNDTVGLPTAPGVTSVPSRARASTLSAKVSAPIGSKTTSASSSRTLGSPYASGFGAERAHVVELLGSRRCVHLRP